MNKGTKSRLLTGMLWSLLLIAFAGLVIAGVYLVPYVLQAARQYHAFLNLHWAHESDLVKILLNLILALWALVTVIFFDGWLIHRVLRKLRGKTWAIIGKDNKNHYFPAVSTYVKASILFLIIGWLFVIIQYPLQFM